MQTQLGRFLTNLKNDELEGKARGGQSVKKASDWIEGQKQRCTSSLEL